MYKALISIFCTYWRDYGGLKELFLSPFFHLSIVSSILYALGVVTFSWREFVLSSLPTILGFSLAAYAITFSLMGSAIHRALSVAIDDRQGISLKNIVNSTFFHVLVVQVFSLIYAILSKGSLIANFIKEATSSDHHTSDVVNRFYFAGDVFGFFLTTYSVTLLLTVGIAMFRLGRLNPDIPARPKLTGANDDIAPQQSLPDITTTIRFKLITRLARILRMYEPPKH